MAPAAPGESEDGMGLLFGRRRRSGLPDPGCAETGLAGQGDLELLKVQNY